MLFGGPTPEKEPGMSRGRPRRFVCLIECWSLAALVSVTWSAPGTRTNLERFYVRGAAVPIRPVRGSDGAVWFAYEKGIGRIASGGQVDLHPTRRLWPQIVTAGPDNT